MNPDNLTEAIQKGFRIAVGATATLVESLQDAQKREETFAKIQSPDLGKLTEELAEKGAVTEQEARNFVETLLNQSQGTANPTPGATTADPTPASEPVASADSQQEVRDLTAQIAALRAELEKLQSGDKNS